MFLTSIATLLSALFSAGWALTVLPLNTTTSSSSPQTRCTQFKNIENGFVKIDDNGYEQIAVVSCEEGYDLHGSPNIYCMNGKWEHYSKPECSKRCTSPPYVKDGSLEINAEKDENGMFMKGTLATYSCGEGFYLVPKESNYRVCEKGIWTGPYATCLPYVKVTGCPAPKDVENGYFVHEKTGILDGFNVGQRLHYSCKPGYVLIGASFQQCLDDGTWSPKIQPVCSPQVSGQCFTNYSPKIKRN